MTIFRSRALLVYLPILLLTSCTASRRAVVIHPPPTEVLGSEEREAELRRSWEVWDELRHRTPPGMSWRAVDRDPGQARRLYALTLDWRWEGRWVQDYKLYRSENGGLELDMISSGRDIGWADLWIDRIEGGPLYLASRQGVQVSTDGGLTFSTLAPLPAPMDEIVLAGSEAGAPTLYAAIKSPGP